MDLNGLRIAVTGLGRGDNPQPGFAVIEAIRQAWPESVVIGLAYDPYESGLYAKGAPDHGFLMPYPSAGLEPYLSRLAQVAEIQPFVFFLPTLDSELSLLSGHGHRLQALGIRACLPDTSLLRLVAKGSLPAGAHRWGLVPPKTEVAATVDQALLKAEVLGYPLMVKGHFCDAYHVNSSSELLTASSLLFRTWGAPVILQEKIIGAEINVMGLADGEGELLAHCSVRKFMLTSKGKASGSVVIRDERLEAIVRQFVRETLWLGPFELEMIQDQRDQSYTLIEVNPRFPAWVGFPAQVGANYPAAWIRWALFGVRESIQDLPVGTFFLRHQSEVVGSVSQVSELIHG